MFLRQLLIALAKRGKPKEFVLPDPDVAVYSGPIRVPKKKEYPALEPVEAFSGPIDAQSSLPKDKALEAIYGEEEDALDKFLKLPAIEQKKLITDELEKLSERERLVIADLLKKELSAKWIPQPRQAVALTSPADIVLYGGQAGGGKSNLILGLALTEHKRSLVMRREYDDLSFLTQEAIKINGTRDGFRASPHPTLVATDGRLVEFRAAQRVGDEQSRQGQPFDLLAFDEAAQFAEQQIRFLLGWLRTTETKQRCRVILASNPPLSDEGQWLVKMFAAWLDPQHPRPAKAGELRWFVSDELGEDKEVEGEGPHEVGNRKVKAKSRTFIPARLSDNAYLTQNDQYASQLDSLFEPLRSAVRDGNFMAVRKDDAYQVIPSEWIRLAQSRWTQIPPPGQPMTCLAIDPNGGGKDAATIARRYGLWFDNVVSERGPQTMDGRYIGAKALMLRKNNCQLVVDVGGGYGGDTVNVMKDNDVPTVGYKGADASHATAFGSGLQFANRRAQDWWQFREALDPANPDKISLPPDQELAADLGTPRLHGRALQQKGIIQIESKEQIRDRLGRSPDKGDAVVMCRAFGGLLEFRRREQPKYGRVVTTPLQAKRLGLRVVR